MRFKYLSYHTLLVLVFCVILFFTTNLSAAEIYLDPATSYLTGSVGEEFQIELKVDENTLGIRLFQVFIKFESSLLDTVSSALGPLFENSGYSTFYNMKIIYDTTTTDSIIKVEGLLLGASSVVDGPGTVAILNFRTAGIGVADISILKHTLTDINNDTITSTSNGAVAYINTPPDSFNLLSPLNGVAIQKFPGEFIECSWESSNTPFPGENIIYELQYSSNNSFPVPNTVTVSALTGTTYMIPADDLENGFVYWRVKAIGDIYSFMQNSNQYPDYFDFTFATQEPEPFDLITPANDHLENLIGDDNILFDWEDALPGSPGDIIEYTFYIGETSIFPQPSLVEVQSGINSQISVVSDSLPLCQEVYWTVEAKNQHGLSRWANSVHSSTFINRGDINCSGGAIPIDISDIIFFVAFMFGGGDAPTILETGNVNCSTSIPIIDISDLVFIVSYAFSGGLAPDCDM